MKDEEFIELYGMKKALELRSETDKGYYVDNLYQALVTTKNNMVMQVIFMLFVFIIGYLVGVIQ